MQEPLPSSTGRRHTLAEVSTCFSPGAPPCIVVSPSVASPCEGTSSDSCLTSAGDGLAGLSGHLAAQGLVGACSHSDWPRHCWAPSLPRLCCRRRGPARSCPAARQLPGGPEGVRHLAHSRAKSLPAAAEEEREDQGVPGAEQDQGAGAPGVPALVLQPGLPGRPACLPAARAEQACTAVEPAAGRAGACWRTCCSSRGCSSYSTTRRPQPAASQPPWSSPLRRRPPHVRTAEGSGAGAQPSAAAPPAPGWRLPGGLSRPAPGCPPAH